MPNGRTTPSRSVNGRPTSASTIADTAVASSVEDVRLPWWATGNQRMPAPLHERARPDQLSVAPGPGPEAAVVDLLRDELADRRVQPPGLVEEHAAVVGHGGVGSEDVLEGRRPGAVGVRARRRLGQLTGIADEDEVAGRGRHGQHVGERELTRLVDDEHVERVAQLGPREQPGRAGDHVDAGGDLVVDVGVVGGQRHGRRAPRPPRGHRASGWPAG